MYECDDKMVSHPSHYQSESGLEVKDVIKAFTSDLSGVEAWDTGNVLKYVCRWKNKNGLQDLKKAQWYLTDLIDSLENKKSCIDISGDKLVINMPNENCCIRFIESMTKLINKKGYITNADINESLAFAYGSLDFEFGIEKQELNNLTYEKHGNSYAVIIKGIHELG